MYLGCYLRMDIDVGPNLKVNILKSDVEMVHHSSYHSLLTEEFIYEKELKHPFDVKIEEKLGPKAVAKDLGIWV